MTGSRPEVQFVRAVAEGHGWRVHNVRFIEGAGSVNHVARLTTPDGDLIVRFHRDPLRPNEFPAETWCARAAAAAGVPTPAVLADGALDGRAYGVQEYVAGTPPESTERIWGALGEYGALIGSIDLAGAPDGVFGRFGRDLPAAWRSHVEFNLASLGPDDPLVRRGVYLPGDVRRIEGLLERTLRCERFGLVHGDLKPQNLIQDATGRLVLIDWGCAQTGPVPWLDVVVVAGRETADGGEPGSTASFLRGCGTPADGALLDAHRLLSGLDLVRWSMDHRPELIEGHSRAATAEVRRIFR